MRILFIFISFLSMAAGAVDWEAKFKSTCQYDDNCGRLRESDGTWLKPKPEIVKLLKNPDMQKEIQVVAQKYGVSPLAIAGSILAENSLNVSAVDTAQTWLAKKMGITSVAGKQFTVGLGQINVNTAVEADTYVAKLEGRPPKSRDELTKEVTDPVGSVRVVGAILRKIQDDYKEQGFDISKDPPVLTTVYNLGKSEEKAKAAKAAGRAPRANFFGLFVEKYTDDINKYISPPSAKSIAQKVPTPAAVKNATPVKGTDDVPAVAKVNKAPKKLEKIETVSASLPLVSQPLDCQTQYGQDSVRQAETTSYGAPTGILEKNQGYTEVSKGFDCKSNVWQLVRSETGVAGWVAQDALDKVKTFKYEEPVKCGSSKAGADCLSAIKKAAPDMIRSEEPKDGLVYLKPVTAPNTKEASFKYPDQTCGFEAPEVNDSPKFGIIRHKKNPGPIPSQAELQASAKQVYTYAETALTNLQKATGLSRDDLSGPQNPYANAAGVLQYAQSMARTCLQSMSTESVNCSDFTKIVKDVEAVSQMQFKKNPTVDDVLQTTEIMKLNRNVFGFNRAIKYTNYGPQANGKNPYSVAELKESIKVCRERLEKVIDPAQIQKMQTAAPISGGGMYAGLSPYQMSFLKGVENSSDEMIQEHTQELSVFSDFCHARLNLVGTDGVPEKYSCIQAKTYVLHGYQNFSRNLVADSYKKNPAMIAADFSNSWEDIVPHEIHAKFAGVKSAANEDRGSPNSYCPNKTAEFVAELLEKNDCIERVYMPSKVIVKKLSGENPKVLFREFEYDGVYAIAFKGAGQCKKK